MAVLEGADLTPAEAVALIEADHIHVDAACDLLDADDALILDISDDLVTGSVQLAVDRTLHRTARLEISRELQWGWQRLRPWLLLSSDGETWHRWPLGVFLISTPERRIDSTPAVWTVDCFDKLDVLVNPHVDYSLASGELILEAVEDLITGAGESNHGLDQAAAATTTPADRVFPMSENMTTLEICNTLLASLAYEPLWVDRNGVFRSSPQREPADRPTVWSYSTASSATTVAQQRSVVADFYKAANQVIGVNTDGGALTYIPTEGDGIYTASNLTDGPTSVAGRGGRTIRKVFSEFYANQAALVTAVSLVLAEEKRVDTLVSMSVSPNPVHGMHDIVSLTDPDASIDGRFAVTGWSIPLDGRSDMKLTLRGV